MRISPTKERPSKPIEKTGTGNAWRRIGATASIRTSQVKKIALPIPVDGNRDLREGVISTRSNAVECTRESKVL